MAKSATKTVDIETHVEAVIYHLNKLIDPLLNALKEVPVPSRQTSDGQPVTGQEQRRDAMLRFILQGLGNSIEHQLKGQMGGDFLNATQMVTRSDTQFRELQRKYPDDDEGMVMDRRYHPITAWWTVNEERVKLLEALSQINCTVYERVAGQPFVAQSFTPKSETAVSAAMTDAQKKARLAQLAKLKEKKAVCAA